MLAIIFYKSSKSHTYAYSQVNDSECNVLKLSAPGNSHILEGYAVFDGPTLTGTVTFVSDVRQRCRMSTK